MAPVAHNLLSRSQPAWPAVSQPFATFHNLGARPVAEHAPTEIHNLKKLDIETPERGRRHRGDGGYQQRRLGASSNTNTR